MEARVHLADNLVCYKFGEGRFAVKETILLCPGDKLAFCRLHRKKIAQAEVVAESPEQETSEKDTLCSSTGQRGRENNLNSEQEQDEDVPERLWLPRREDRRDDVGGFRNRED
ncbi:hypothetical protein NEOLI_000695 [Neolecta irregularis DAH-3]|uniref:Uncharacterized protein n=1 Tax=Neolecta irregularis (strain DAH-3) TaxID=1198029 RepID=A0A1U7LW88_NEOID|nr:hypothetical protein NEOLI_000695 [Neolecta irregularis DAH-3]|eukprot:OLL26889.1 hypothetical protein NEOLI_000695 [Neolecta irregularis DAH-3]